MIALLGGEDRNPYIAFFPNFEEGKVSFINCKFINVNDGGSIHEIEVEEFDIEEEFYINLQLSIDGDITGSKIVPLSKYDEAESELDRHLNLFIPLCKINGEDVVEWMVRTEQAFYGQIIRRSNSNFIVKKGDKYLAYFAGKESQGDLYPQILDHTYQMEESDKNWAQEIRAYVTDPLYGKYEEFESSDYLIKPPTEEVIKETVFKDIDEFPRKTVKQSRLGIDFGSRVLPYGQFPQSKKTIGAYPKMTLAQQLSFLTDIFGDDSENWPYDPRRESYDGFSLTV